jgi:FixJ family two-component response regulator
MPKTPVISIVDDDETVRDGTLDLLKSMGFRAVAYSGLELHSGLVRLGNIIPTILITAYPDGRDRSRGLQAGLICEIMNDDTMERVPYPIHPHR